ncbi:MAG: hypothetical protein PHC75_10615, partial [Burkholderiales bacterium]|nr:hypothetical protein [Burkholderiales bacterium]
NQDSYELANRYNYVNGDPVNYSDPTGHFAMPNWLNYTLGGIGVAVSGIATVATMGIATPATTALGVASTTLFAGGLGTQIAADNVTDENAKQILNYTSLGLNAAGIVTGIGYANGVAIKEIGSGTGGTAYKQGAYVFKRIHQPSSNIIAEHWTLEREVNYFNQANATLRNSYMAEIFNHPKLGLTMRTPYIKYSAANNQEIYRAQMKLSQDGYHILDGAIGGNIVKDTSGQLVVLDAGMVVNDNSHSFISSGYGYVLAQDNVKDSIGIAQAEGAYLYNGTSRSEVVIRRKETLHNVIDRSNPLKSNDKYHFIEQKEYNEGVVTSYYRHK